MAVNRCLVCYTLIDSGREDTCSTENDSFLSKDLHVIFLLRNLFDVPREKLENYLSHHGSPSDWKFFNFCKGCGEAVGNAKRIYQEVLEALRIFMAVKGEIVKTVKRSWRRHNDEVKDHRKDKTLAQQNSTSCGGSLKARIVDDTREFIFKHDYGPLSNPYEDGDLIAVDYLHSFLPPSRPPKKVEIDPEAFPSSESGDEHLFCDDGDGFEDLFSSDSGNLLQLPVDIKIEVPAAPILGHLLRKDNVRKRQPFLKQKPKPARHKQRPGSKITTNSTAHQMTKNVPKRKLQPLALKCDYEGCGKIFRYKHGLQQHLMRHRGDTPFHCNWPDCTWKFTRADVFRRHYENHYNKRKYPCEHCPKAFNRPDNLRRHVETNHLKS